MSQIDFKKVKVKHIQQLKWNKMRIFALFKKSQARISKIRIKGLAKTKDEYVRAHFEDVFEKTTNFEELLNETDSLKKRLLSIGCFKTVEVLIDSSKGKFSKMSSIVVSSNDH